MFNMRRTSLFYIAPTGRKVQIINRHYAYANKDQSVYTTKIEQKFIS